MLKIAQRNALIADYAQRRDGNTTLVQDYQTSLPQAKVQTIQTPQPANTLKNEADERKQALREWQALSTQAPDLAQQQNLSQEWDLGRGR